MSVQRETEGNSYQSKIANSDWLNSLPNNPVGRWRWWLLSVSRLNKRTVEAYAMLFHLTKYGHAGGEPSATPEFGQMVCLKIAHTHFAVLNF